MKQCYKCKKIKKIKEFYKHRQMKDGHINKCKKCFLEDSKAKNGKEKRVCVVCSNSFRTNITEVKRGGGNCCSRGCWYKHFRKTVKRGKNSPNWKGDNVGFGGLHDWVKKHLGKPKRCEHCGTKEAKLYDWANKSREYKRELSDWVRLCRQCHVKFDQKEKVEKWRKTVRKRYGWKTKTTYISPKSGDAQNV